MTTKRLIRMVTAGVMLVTMAHAIIINYAPIGVTANDVLRVNISFPQRPGVPPFCEAVVRFLDGNGNVLEGGGTFRGSFKIRLETGQASFTDLMKPADGEPKSPVRVEVSSSPDGCVSSSIELYDISSKRTIAYAPQPHM